VLVKAKEMGMKIWALEKLQRMMTTMFDTNTGAQAQHGYDTRSNAANQGLPKTTLATNLSQLLREERLNGPSDRDPTVATKEMIPLKGPYLYVRDAEEKVRPIMVREYPKVAHREDGDWPQFRSVSHGKCPFVEEVAHSRRDLERERIRERNAQLKREAAPRTRAAIAAREANKMQPPPCVKESRALREDGNAGNRGPAADGEAPKPRLFEPPAQLVPTKRGSPERSFHTSRNQHIGDGRAASQFFGGEPIASGLQQSNITSAIRSQMISSTAAAPGAKAGLSKEVHELKRKVLEKNAAPAVKGLISTRGQLDSHTKNERLTTNFRVAKRRAQQKLGFVDEDFTPSEEEENVRQMEAIQKARANQARSLLKREPKPGYCENCREKFDDFDEVGDSSLTKVHLVRSCADS
jgi:regulatory subunit for Cdc7p protein kinase